MHFRRIKSFHSNNVSLLSVGAFIRDHVAIRGAEHEFKCTVCCKISSFVHQGEAGISCHLDEAKHKDRVKGASFLKGFRTENDPIAEQDALVILRSLLSSGTLSLSKEDMSLYQLNKLPFMRIYMRCLGISAEEQDSLSVIHVTGTKGKGSTCAYTESILRHKGYKTGFFSSPHIFEERERIRINGNFLSEEKFRVYFWFCFDRIQADCQHLMPTFFQFMTLLAYYTFLKEKVDVVILEVGIGGKYDCTNIVRNPVVCGITNLHIDHVQLLGDTLESITAHKAGIFKPGATAIISPQLENALQVLQQTAKEKKCALYMAPQLLTYNSLDVSMLVDKENFQLENMSLAIQLSRVWLYNHDKDATNKEWVDTYDGETIPYLDTAVPNVDDLIHTMDSVQWYGRLQIIKRPNITYYVDGAHTEESMKVCCKWFQRKSEEEIKAFADKKVMKILIFNLTGGRNPNPLLTNLKKYSFDAALFTPIKAYIDTHNPKEDDEESADQCRLFENLWVNLKNGSDNTDPASTNVLNSGYNQNSDSKDTMTRMFPCLYDALYWCNQGRDSALSKLPSTEELAPSILTDANHVQVLITGSLYLVTSALAVFSSTTQWTMQSNS